ncbi:DUF1761 domain-containing protein [Qaidamihabitans albus]|uniref:DUF1761 domain-containing protein n=1 Tax=Qaidamihabitans albus TaxID=2795733 RepID=UPI0018F147EE|nr:DUF1761 domain-containing protein [Qaidamihabitans albus]
MTEFNYVAVLVAAVAAFVVSGAWYAAFGSHLARLHDAYADAGRPPPSVAAAEVVRSAVVAAVLAGLLAWTGIESWGGAVALGLVAWVGFPVVILSGSVLHEKVPWRLAAIHAGDWLVKLLVITTIVGIWR